MDKMIGYCHACRQLSEYQARPVPSAHVRPTCYRPTPGMPGEAEGRAVTIMGYCGGAVCDLWDTHPVAKAVMAAFLLSGFEAARAIWVDAGSPELAYEW